MFLVFHGLRRYKRRHRGCPAPLEAAAEFHLNNKALDKDTSYGDRQAIKAAARPRAGKGAARAERRAGRVPGIIYGDSETPLPISLDYADLRQRIYAGHFLTTIHDIEVDGTKHRVIPRDFQLDPVRDLPVHVDFMRLGEGATIRVSIPIHVMNADQSPGVKRGGTVNDRDPYRRGALPRRRHPDGIEVDVGGLEINHSRHLSDIKLPQACAVVAAATLRWSPSCRRRAMRKK